MRALLQQRTLKQNRGKTKSEEEDRTWYILLHDGKSCIKRNTRKEKNGEYKAIEADEEHINNNEERCSVMTSSLTLFLPLLFIDTKPTWFLCNLNMGGSRTCTRRL